MTSGPFPLGVPLEPYYQDELVTLYHEDCLDALRQLPDASVDSVVTDPPYGLEFMGKDWDRFGTPRAPSTAGRSGEGVQRGSAGIAKDSRTPQGRTGVAFGGSRPTTWRCDSCGKRDQFRAHSAKVPDCQGTWRLEVIDPDAPSPLLGFQLWSQEWAAEALRVLKPGGHLLAFGGTRTWHRLAVAIEDAGFEIRDSIAWMYGSGFPKSLDVSKAIDKAAGAERQVVGTKVTGAAMSGKPSGVRLGTGGTDFGSGQNVVDITAPATPDAARWQGWGTALKPAHEPVVVARKPLTGTVAGNVLEHGTGALNIDGCRIGTAGATKRASQESRKTSAGWTTGHDIVAVQAGRWPANVVLDEDQAAALDKQSGVTTSQGGQHSGRSGTRNMVGGFGFDRQEINRPTDSGGASRFFYVAKAPARERPKVDGIAHPTVKPLTLMRWLCRLVTPPGGVVLEPFAGSGTTIEAALLEGFRVVAIEREPDYLPLIAARLERVAQEPNDGQLTFDASA